MRQTLLKQPMKMNWREENWNSMPEYDSINKLCRNAQTKVFRLKIRHCKLKAHLQLVGLTDTATCRHEEWVSLTLPPVYAKSGLTDTATCRREEWSHWLCHLQTRRVGLTDSARCRREASLAHMRAHPAKLPDLVRQRNEVWPAWQTLFAEEENVGLFKIWTMCALFHLYTYSRFISFIKKWPIIKS